MSNEFNDVYLTIPRDVVLNYQSRKHREDKFRTLYHYRKKNRFKFNTNDIQEIDIFKVKEVQIDTLYKSTFKCNKDKYFDWFYCLKEKYNSCDNIYIENHKKETLKTRKTYLQNRDARKADLFKNRRNNLTKGMVVTFD